MRLLLDFDPLAALSNALATRALYQGFLWSLSILIPTLCFGRFFCGWMCPLGTLHHFFGNLKSERRLGRQRIESNCYKSRKSRHLDAPAVAHVIGPIPMMQAGARLTKEWCVPTFASLNPIMVDGTGMCGGCRVAVGGRVRFTCIDRPEFDAHQVDFDELARRNRAYLEQERLALELT